LHIVQTLDGVNMKPVDPVVLTGKKRPTDQDVRRERLNICNSCEFLTKERLCTQCACYVDEKTGLMNQFCPLRKW